MDNARAGKKDQGSKKGKVTYKWALSHEGNLTAKALNLYSGFICLPASLYL
jgi:hypothetical protein